MPWPGAVTRAAARSMIQRYPNRPGDLRRDRARPDRDRKRACRQQGALQTYPTEIRNFAETFVELQGARHEADYALEGEYFKSDVLALVDTAEDAVNEFGQADVRRQRGFAVHVLFKRRQAIGV